MTYLPDLLHLHRLDRLPGFRERVRRDFYEVTRELGVSIRSVALRAGLQDRDIYNLGRFNKTRIQWSMKAASAYGTCLVEEAARQGRLDLCVRMDWLVLRVAQTIGNEHG